MNAIKKYGLTGSIVRAFFTLYANLHILVARVGSALIKRSIALADDNAPKDAQPDHVRLNEIWVRVCLGREEPPGELNAGEADAVMVAVSDAVADTMSSLGWDEGMYKVHTWSTDDPPASVFPGKKVVLGRHTEVSGFWNWNHEMERFVGKKTIVTDVVGRDSVGCLVANVKIDGGTFLWRVRDMTDAPPK